MSNYWKQPGDQNAELNALLQAYRAACPETEPSANFMPEIWRRIEERQRSQFFLGHWARTFVTAAAVLCLGMAVYQYIPQTSATTFSVESYVEAVAAGHGPETIDPIVDEL